MLAALSSPHRIWHAATINFGSAISPIPPDGSEALIEASELEQHRNTAAELLLLLLLLLLVPCDVYKYGVLAGNDLAVDRTKADVVDVRATRESVSATRSGRRKIRLGVVLLAAGTNIHAPGIARANVQEQGNAPPQAA